LFLLQRRSIVIGFIWIVLGSFLLEFSGLGSGHALAGIVAASAAAALDQLVFSRRSSWALLAEAAGAIAVYVLIRLLWLLVVQLVIGTELEFFVKLKIAALSWLMSLLAFMVFTWSWQQLVRWTGRVFVGRNKNYEVVFSNKK
jgi:hypothetical protein